MPHPPIPKELPPLIERDGVPDYYTTPAEMPPTIPAEMPDWFSKPSGPWVEVSPQKVEHFPQTDHGMVVSTPKGPSHLPTIPRELPGPKSAPLEIPQLQEWLLGK